MIRVLHYTSGLAPIRAGVEIFIMNLYENLNKNEFKFFILTRNSKPNSNLHQEMQEKGIEIYDLDCPHLGLGTLLQYYISLDVFLKNHAREFDFVHMHGIDDPFVIGLAKKYHIKHTAAHVHAIYRENKSFIKSIIKKYTSESNINHAEYLLACSKEAGKSMYNRQDFSVINNCISTKDYAFDEEKRRLVRSELHLESDNIAFCFVGRFTGIKNIPFLISVFYRVVKLLPKSRLFLIGDGEEKKEVELLIHRLGIQDFVVLTGQRSDISDFLQGMDIYIQASINEGFSLSALEAQCSGLPTYVSNGFPDEIMITDNIFRFSKNNTEEEWAARIVDDIKENNYEKRDGYSKIVYEAGFDSIRFAEQMAEVYRK